MPGLLALALCAAGPARVEGPQDALLDPSGWTSDRVLPAPLQHHRAVAEGGSLIVVGGRDRFNKLQAGVWTAEVDEDDGSLGAWEPGPALPSPVAQHGAAALQGALYVTGGLKAAKVGEVATDEVWRAATDRRVGLRAWERAGRMPEALSSHGMVASLGRLWVVGGLSPAGYRNGVWSAAPVPGGRGALAWKAATPLPQPLAHTALVAVDKYLIVIGGQTPGEGRTLVLPTVYVGPVFEDGTVSTWYLASSKLPGAWLSFGRNQANALAWRDTLFCFGGQDALWFLLDTIAAAPFDTKRGTVGGWAVVQGAAELPQLTAAALWNDRVYLVGGTIKGAVTPKVFRGTLSLRDREDGS